MLLHRLAQRTASPPLPSLTTDAPPIILLIISIIIIIVIAINIIIDI
jgi:hypothetical protein